MSPHVRIFKASVSFFDLAKVEISLSDVVATPGYRYRPCDIAVVYGIASQARRGLQARLRRAVHAEHKGPLLVVESGMIGRTFRPRPPSLVNRLLGRPQRPKQNHLYLRVAVGGALGDDADFNNVGSPSDRWDRLKAELGIQLQPYRTAGRHVLLIGQVENDASLRGVEMVFWLPETARAIRRHTDRPIRLRLHPVMRWPHRKAVLAAIAAIPGIELSPPERPIADDFRDAWSCVTFSSGAAIDALLAGIPPICLSSASLAYAISSRSISDVEQPLQPDRGQWLSDLCYGQWTVDELQDGTAWRHIEPAVAQRL